MRKIIYVLSCIISFSAFAGAFPCSTSNFRVIPVGPTEDDRIRIELSGGCACSLTPHDPLLSISRDDDDVYVDLRGPQTDACLAVPVSWSRTFELGKLPPGTYNVHVRWGGEPLGNGTVRVIEAFRALPSFGTAGTEVLLTGANISDATRVLFGAADATSFRVIDRDRIAAIAPPHSAGTTTISVVRAGGATASFTFEYALFPATERYARVLFPLATSVSGAFGSEWRTDNWLRNDGLIAITTENSTTPVQPGQRIALPTFNENRGFMIGIPREQLAGARFSSHARDVSRGALDAGTEIRVVTEDRTGDTVAILAVPLAENYRYQLRVYNIDSYEATVTVRLNDAGGQLAGERSIELEESSCHIAPAAPCNSGEPGFASLDLRELAAGKTGPFDVTITGPDGARLWAFVSATNNDTQHVTTYSPQP